MDSLWARLREGRSELEVVVAVQAMVLAAFWLFSFGFFLLDWFQPTWALACRCQKTAPPDFKLMRKVAWTVLSHHLTVYPVTTVFLFRIFGHRLDFSLELPSLATALRQILILAVMLEPIFYYLHRLLHHPTLYPHVHKRHHEVKVPFGVCALYFHPLESVTPVLETFVPSALLGTHVIVFAAFALIATLNVVIHHCGYELPWLPDRVPFSGFDTMALQHDDHHKHFNVCFGIFGLLDWLHGTAKPMKRAS